MMTECEKFISVVDNDILKPSDAIILLEGDGLNRYQKAVELYKQNIAAKIVFSGNITDYAYGSFPFSDILPHVLNAGVPTSAVIHEDRSLNTKEQAVEVVRMAIKNSWKRFTLDEQIDYIKQTISLQSLVADKFDVEIDQKILESLINRLKEVY